MSIQDMSLNDMYLMRDNKINHQNAKTQIEKDVYHLNNQNIRSAYGLSDTDDVPLAELNQYIAAAEEVKGRNDTKKALLTKVTNTETNPNIQKSADAIKNFNYNPSKDAAYQAYVDAYNRQGQSAAKQTLNNLNSANMGRNSSYSSAATAQVQQAYAKQASEMIPTLAQQAYERLVNNYSIARDMDDTQYNRALTGYQALADDYTRGLTDKQLELNNQMSEIDLKYYEPNAQIAHDMNKLNYDMGLLEYGDAKFNSDLNRKYAEQQILAGLYGGGSSRGGSSGGSSSSGVDMKKVGDFIKSFNSSMSGKSYYTDNVGEGNIINGTGATLSWGENIGGTGAWMGPLISQLYSNPELSENDIMYIENKLGLNEEREFKVKTGEDENGNPIYETVTATPKDHFKYAIPY